MLLCPSKRVSYVCDRRVDYARYLQSGCNFFFRRAFRHVFFPRTLVSGSRNGGAFDGQDARPERRLGTYRPGFVIFALGRSK